MPIKLEITADTAEQLQRLLREAQPGGPPKLDIYSTDALLEELRVRMRPEGLVVNIEPFEPLPTSPDATPPASAVEPAKKRGRPPKDVAPAPPIDKPATAVNVPEEPKKIEPSATSDAMKMPATVGKDQVVAALNEYATARGGQVAAREVMSKTCGSTRLADIPPEKWGDLVAALQVAA
jgi:hypothetical protein